MRRSFALAAFTLVLPLAAVTARAHGGSYQPPAGEVPPESREPSDPPPPDDGAGPGTPGGEDGQGPGTPGGDVGGGPGTPGGDGSGPKTGGGGGPPPTGGGPGGGVSTGTGKRRSTGPGFEDWQYWWTLNHHEILSVRGLLRSRRAPASGTSSHGLGANGGAGTAVRLATDAVVDAEVLPLLRERLADVEENFDVRAAAAIALAKIRDPLSIGVLRDLARGDRGTHRVVAESAALALGLYEMDDAEIREALVDATLDRTQKTGFVRPFSALGLGFQPAQGASALAAQTALLEVIARNEPGEDVKPACLVALGLREDPAALPALLRIVRTRRVSQDAAALDDLEVGQAVQALGRIGRAGSPEVGDTAVVDLLLSLAAKDDDQPAHVRRGVAIALGHVAPAAPPKLLDRAVAALSRTGRECRDAQERHYALIALGRIGADARTTDAARRECVATLDGVLEKGQPSNLVRPFAALGLGLVGRGLAASGRTVDEETIRRPIRDAFEAAKDVPTRSAFALASGLVRDPRAADGLLDVLGQPTAQAKLRGYAALALGLIGDSRAAPVVRALAVDAADRELQVQAATATGLLGDPRAVDDLVAVLGDPERSQYVLGSAAVALGTIGDERAVRPLCAIVRDTRNFPELTRALAVVALGRLGDRRDVPPLGRLATDFDYRAYVAATREVLTIL